MPPPGPSGGQLARALAGADVIHLHYPLCAMGSRALSRGGGVLGRDQEARRDCHIGCDGRRLCGGFGASGAVPAGELPFRFAFDYARTCVSWRSRWPAKCRETVRVDADRFRPPIQGARSARGSCAPEAPVVGFVGGMDTAHAFKGVDYC